MTTTQSRQPTELLTMIEAGKELGRTRGSAHYMRITGQLPSIWDGQRWLTTRQAVEKLRNERAAKSDK